MHGASAKSLAFKFQQHSAELCSSDVPQSEAVAFTTNPLWRWQHFRADLSSDFYTCLLVPRVSDMDLQAICMRHTRFSTCSILHFYAKTEAAPAIGPVSRRASHDASLPQRLTKCCYLTPWEWDRAGQSHPQTRTLILNDPAKPQLTIIENHCMCSLHWVWGQEIFVAEKSPKITYWSFIHKCAFEFCVNKPALLQSFTFGCNPWCCLLAWF